MLDMWFWRFIVGRDQSYPIGKDARSMEYCGGGGGMGVTPKATCDWLDLTCDGSQRRRRWVLWVCSINMT